MTARWRNMILAYMALAACTAFYGCGTKSVIVNIKDFPLPVMVSPVVRIGDTAPPQPRGSAFSSFECEASHGGSASSGQHTEQRYGQTYLVTETTTNTFKLNNVENKIWTAAANRRDLVAMVDELQAGSWVHISLIGVWNEWIGLKGKLYDPTRLDWRKTK